ncbi:tyrosine--tRNA ligase [Candidatus Berkelbacteria bacterium CG10_big_fil_rev_8_21_14_0_10_43_13]|uniref:Tyrosine--tRNA ligase n=1 Tax=Candidatus Berkelbacteria bacterium CG10_big_fil_rev_8_21_14_0_10_43_13 TaxID=1974514 RepID=A0A2H0W727_9BACT|nr:MAG: tyrosine--tRNA ligase [Candidatus Berkelbacteria bacterium CG10_big_fil_rev_8_21_14_0_10_43_13]
MNKDFFERGIEEIIVQSSFEEKLKSKKPLRIKMGFDPTRPDIHLGHAVGLWKLKELQDAGHKIIFLVGDYTTKIGDPSGRNSTRPVLTDAEIEQNARTYFDQVGKILNVKKAEIRANSEWFAKMSFGDILQLVGKFTAAQILERDDFAKRLDMGNDISLHELLYPVMQAYDSVMLRADVEFGGTDQKFNLLAGRDLQKKMGQAPQNVVMVKLLVGLDGKEKMSKSADNYISITEESDQMFGKIMSIPDGLIIDYFSLCTLLSDKEIEKVGNNLRNGANPRDIKLLLAEEIVTLYHTKKESLGAKKEFLNRFSKKELPTDIPEISIPEKNIDILTFVTLADESLSKSDARRVIEQGGVKIDGTKITDPLVEIGIKKGLVIQIGKLKVYKVKK